jgi:integrase
MTRLPLRYVQAWVDREGRVHRYFRRPGYPRARLPGLPGSAEFNRAYEEAIAAVPPPIGAARTRPGSLSAVLVAYYGSQRFRGLAAGTRALWRQILERWRETDGDKPIAVLPKEFIVRKLDGMKPHAARNWLKAIRHLMAYCLDHGLIRHDPTAGIKRKLPRSDGHHTWAEDEIAQFEAAHPIGSKARLALALGIYTAQRRGDVIRMGRQHIKNGVLSVTQEKTGARLAIPVHPELQQIIDATTTGHLTLLVTKSGKSYGRGDFSEQFRAWRDAAGLPQRCKFHGLRKAALTRLADIGCSAHEIAAISGHKSLKEVERYTRNADQARLARAAMARTLNETGTPTVKPDLDEVSKPLRPLRKKAQ